jgi:serine/threonine protein kinase
MSQPELPSTELAKIDAVCLQYENELRSGRARPIDAMIELHKDLHPSTLRHELTLVLQDLIADGVVDKSSPSPLTPFSPAIDLPRLPSPGEMLGPYEIEEKIDQGGMGIIYRAIDTRLRRDVAIKVLAPALALRPELVERFDRESRAVASLSHPNIVELFDVGRFGEIPYAVMEFLRGRTLEQATKLRPLPFSSLAEIALAITDALSTAHAAGIVHRDLKPQNIMLVARGENKPTVKIFDFGLSRVLQDSAVAQASDGQTVEGTILGTPGYMAPEQIAGDRSTAAVDLFSLGAILFECWTGQVAFAGSSRAERITSTLQATPRISPQLAQAHPAIAAVIERCLEKDPSLRPASAAEVNRIFRQEPVTSDSYTSQSRPSQESVVRTRTSESGRPKVDRRKYILGSVACASTAAVWAITRFWPSQTQTIKRLAVLSFSERSVDPVNPMTPLGGRPLTQGEKISTLLTHELSQLPDLSIPAFRPVFAKTPAEYIELGKLLNVDAFLDGEISTEERGQERFLRWTIRLVDAKTGDESWRQTLTTPSSESLLEQTRYARQIADVIGGQIVPTGERWTTPDSSSYSCLLDGKAHSDPDSIQGLTQSIQCFTKAILADQSYPEPIGGLALSAMRLAGRSDDPQAVGQMTKVAQRSIEQVLKLDANSVDGRLADSMFRWQTQAAFKDAKSILDQLLVDAPRDWQVQHQYGLLLMAMGKIEDALDWLTKASLLNPTSALAWIDTARATWYAGDVNQAIENARALANRADNHPWALGLMIDIYESQEKYLLAVELDKKIEATAAASAPLYFAARKERLKDLPYGPFGGLCNQLVWQSRADENSVAVELSSQPVPMPPMLLWLIASHPSLKTARSTSWVNRLLAQASPDDSGLE